MLNAKSIKVGQAYVNERTGAIREVVEEMDRLRIKYNEFDLQTGELIPAPFQVIYRSQLARWADREARAFEMARLHASYGHSWLDPQKPDEVNRAETEMRRATREQAAGANAFHRW